MCQAAEGSRSSFLRGLVCAWGVLVITHRECCDPLVETHLNSHYFDPPVKTVVVKQTNNDVWRIGLIQICVLEGTL